MNSDMPTAQGSLVYEDVSYKIRGCFFTVYNTLGFGHKESVYQKALAVELKKENVPFEQEKPLSVLYNGKVVGAYRPDFIVEDKILIELKAQDFLLKDNETQLLHYLKSTGYMLGFLVNFGARKLDIRRMIWTADYRR